MSPWFLVLLFVTWLAVVAFLCHYRVWLPYYILGAVGLAFWLVIVARNAFHLESPLAQSVAWSVHGISNAIGIPTRIFRRAPGVLLVLVIVQQVGWTILQVGVESSGLLEISVFISLVLFYPGWSLSRRLKAVVLGVLATWVINIIRLQLIVFLLHYLGKSALILAHTYVGKVFFFLATIGIYWYVITMPTVHRENAPGIRSHPAN